ncbi:MAG TPA: ThiF family adenylyltransferase [Verrucomicrobiae bacterium]|nr:ThiF family adenylyltransferase [Verrucomicrobiae bacterium]
MRDKISRLIRLDRQSFLGVHSADVFDQCFAATVGLGGGGSHINQQLVHLGVGNLGIFDPDKVEETNLNRLVGATEEDVAQGRSKVFAAERLIWAVNPWAHVIRFKDKWQHHADELRSCDVIFGCVDSISEREQLETLARRHLIPYIDIGMDVNAVEGSFSIGGQIAVSMPGGACLRCLGIITDSRLREESRRYGAVGGKPQVVWPNGLLASAAIGMFVKLFTPWEKEIKFPILLEYDGDAQTLMPSNKLKYLQGPCPHFDSHSVGDPFFGYTSAPLSSTAPSAE